MKKNLLISLFLLNASFIAGAQNETNHWFFGTYAYLDFSGGAPVVGMGPLTTTEGTASMSDAAGNLMFYTNGVDVWDSTHTIMSNGSGLMGDVSTTQSAIVVPSPVTNTQYYIFTIDDIGGPNGFRYSIVDMTLNSGLGNVTAAKNVALTDSVAEKISVTRGLGGDNYWIVVHKWGTNQFYAYHLTTAGLQPPVITSVGTVHSTSTFQNTYGQMKFNMCGDRLALALGYMDLVELYDFNQNNGVVSNPVSLNLGDNVYGVEFSPSGDLLYATCYDPNVTIAQYNITLANAPLILASKVPLSLTPDLYALQLAPDGKIYVSRSFTSSYLGVIASPDTPGAGCGYNDNGIDLDPGFNGVNGALGLPAFVQSFFGTGDSCTNFLGVKENVVQVLTIFPNPSSDEFTLDLSGIGKPADVAVYNATGKLVEKHTRVSSVLRFGRSLSNGIYAVAVISENKVDTYLIIKE
ncbi:MAG: T9SS type A sorting domain-containing protein [Flavobacteriales bacterium]